MEENPFLSLPVIGQPNNMGSVNQGNPFLSLPAASKQTSARPRFNILDEIKKEGLSDTLDKRIVGLGRGFLDVGQGLKQKYLEGKELIGMSPEGTADQYQKEVDIDRSSYDRTPYGKDEYANSTRVVGNMAPYALMPGGVAGGMLKRMLTGGIAGATTGALQYVPEGGSGTFNTIVGGMLGSAAPPILGALAKGWNAKKGGTETPAQKAVIESGKQHNVPVYAADISENPVIKGASYTLENVPPIPGFSMLPAREAQMGAAKNAAHNLTDDLYHQMQQASYGGKTGMRMIQQAASKGGARSQGANQLLDQMANSGDDWNRILQTSGNVKLFRGKLIADQKYGKVSALADKYGAVDTSNILKAVTHLTQKEQQSVLKNEGLLSTLGKVKQGLLDQRPAQAGSTLVNSNGSKMIPDQAGQIVPKKLTYSQLRQFRSDLGDEISDYFTGKNAVIGQKGVGVLQALKNQVDVSLNKFANTHGNELKVAWRNADHFYKNYITPAKDTLLAKSLKEANPDEIYSKWIKLGDKKDRAGRFYNALDDKGKSAVKYGMVNNAYEAAVKRSGKFSPGRFADEMEKVHGAKDVFFRGQDKAEIDGFSNLMDHVSGSFSAVSKPRTGERTIPWFAGLGAGLGVGTGVISGGTVAAGLAGTAFVKQMLTSNWGRNYLTAASKLQAGTPAMQSLTDALSRALQRGSVVSATQPGEDQ